jgi:hypothetical protein
MSEGFNHLRRPGPGRIASQAGHGFMSAQRRENRWQRRNCLASAGARASIARQGQAFASGGTAPPGPRASFHPSDKDPSPGAPEALATKSLQSDHRRADRRFDRLHRMVGMEIRRGSPPFEAGRSSRRTTSTPGSTRLFPPPISSPSRFHPPLPEIPAGQRRWAERYDGKRDLHFIHAA